MPNTPGRRRLILCKVCFLADCPWSRWVDDDGTLDVLDELHNEYMQRKHTEIEESLASKLTIEEKQERITEAIETVRDEIGIDVEIDNLDELLNREVSRERESESTKIESDLSVDDILKKFSETVERTDENENGKTKGH